MSVEQLLSSAPEFPESLLAIEPAVTCLHYLGDLPGVLMQPRLAVVGARKVTPYGRGVTRSLVEAVARRGVVIISGLALGVDGIAHQAALDARGTTIAVMPGGLDFMYPRSHQGLADDILRQGGVLVSEYPMGIPPLQHHFIARNRIVSGLADAVLVTEAAHKSGTMHTASFALEQGKTVMAVPGNITSELSAGTNRLIRMGAVPVTTPDDILEALGVDTAPQQTTLPVGATPEEQTLLGLLQTGLSDMGELQRQSRLPAHIFNQTLTLLELSDKIRPLGAGHWSIK